MDEVELTVGAVREIRVNGGDGVVGPILQCLSTKAVGTQGATRYRSILSDSQTFIQAMFATSLNAMVDDGVMTKNCIVRVDEYTVNTVKDKTIMIVHKLEVVAEAEGKIGEPAAIESYLQAEAAKSDPADGNDDMQQDIKPKAQQNNPYAANGNGNASRGGASSRGGRGGATSGRGGGNAGRGGGNNMGGGGGMSSQQHPIYPIEGLSPYQNKWTIKARVTNKSDIRHWSNQKGDGKLFSCVFMDETGEIKATGFNDAVDAFYNLLEEGKVYFVSKARIQIAKKQFNNVNNEYEITLDNSSEISLCTDTENIPQVKYNFVQLSELESVEPNAMIDVLGVVRDVGEVGQIVSKATQRPIVKRELTIVDMSGMSVKMTLWGRQAEQFTGPDDGSAPLYAFKGVKVGDFGGRSLSMMSSSSMIVDPDVAEAHELRGWYDSSGTSSNFTSYTNDMSGGGASGGQGAMRPENFKLIGQAKEQMLGTGDQPDYFCVRGQLVFVKKDGLSYPACPTDRCNKKIFQEDNDVWRCSKCDKTHTAPEYRYVLSGQIADFTGFLYMSAFNEIGQQLLGHTADEMEALRHADEAAFNNAIDKAMGTSWDVSVRAKNEVYNDQQKIRYQILKASPVKWSGEEGKRLIDAIAAYD